MEAFKEYINSLPPNIEFSETEEDIILKFLHLILKKDKNNHLLSMYRIPVCTDINKHAKLSYPLQQKIVTFHIMICRLINVPVNKENFDKELSVIK